MEPNDSNPPRPLADAQMLPQGQSISLHGMPVDATQGQGGQAGAGQAPAAPAVPAPFQQPPSQPPLQPGTAREAAMSAAATPAPMFSQAQGTQSSQPPTVPPSAERPASPVSNPGQPGMPSAAIGGARAPEPYNPLRQERQRPPSTPAWQAPSAAAPNEYAMPSPGASTYQRPAQARMASPTTPTHDYQQMAAANARSNRRPLFVIAAVVIALLLIAGGLYFFVFKNKGTGSNDALPETSQSESDLAAVQTGMLIPPQTIEGYTERSTGTPTVRDFVSADGSCELILGTVSAGQLPGKNVDEIIKPQLEQLKQNGAKVDGPNKGAELKLADEKDSNKKYRVPTVTFTFTQGTKKATTHYSAVIAKSGERIVINRTCHKDGDIDQNQLKALNDTASQVKIRTGTK